MYNNAVSIREKAEKIKSYVLNERLFSAFLITVVGIASYGLGRLSVHSGDESAVLRSVSAVEKVEVTKGAVNIETIGTNSGIIEGGYVASKNSDKYHLPWCGGAQRISEANKIFFATKEEAEKAGYKPASNCKGI